MPKQKTVKDRGWIKILEQDQLGSADETPMIVQFIVFSVLLLLSKLHYVIALNIV